MGEKRDWESVRGQALLIWRLNEPADASDTPSDLLWSLAEWHHSGEGSGAGVGEGQEKRKESLDQWWISNTLQLSTEGEKVLETIEETGYQRSEADNWRVEGWAKKKKTSWNNSVPVWTYESGQMSSDNRSSFFSWSLYPFQGHGESEVVLASAPTTRIPRLSALGTAQSLIDWATTTLTFYFQGLVNGTKLVIFSDWTGLFTELCFSEGHCPEMLMTSEDSQFSLFCSVPVLRLINQIPREWLQKWTRMSHCMLTCACSRTPGQMQSSLLCLYAYVKGLSMWRWQERLAED